MRQTPKKRNLYKQKYNPSYYINHGDIVGRIKTKLIKRISLELIRDHEKKLKKDFNENKKAIDKIVNIPSKKARNTISGYVTRLIKEKKE